MEIVYYKSLPSTQAFLIEYLKNNTFKNELLIYTKNQTNGIGSRDNIWKSSDGNLAFSFVVDGKNLPKDLNLSSVSIYFGWIIKDILNKMSSSVYLKWPNDLYVGIDKIGGIITNKKNNYFIVGVGINTKKSNNEFEILDIKLNIEHFFEQLQKEIKKCTSWSRIFKFYELEFYKNNAFVKATVDNEKISLKNAILQKDGSLMINNKKVYSLR